MSDDLLELLATAPAPPMSIDPYAAMATGRRNRTRRRVVTSLVAAAVVALVAGGWAIQGARGDRAIPAGSKVERVSLLLGGQTPDAVPVQSIKVTATRGTGEATFIAVVRGKQVDLGTIEAPGPEGGSMQVSKDGTPPMLLVLLPRNVNAPGLPNIVPSSAIPDINTYYAGGGLLPDSGRSVSVLGFPTREAALKVKALLWTDPQGAIHFTGDSVVRSVRFPGPSGGTRDIFVSEQLKVAGLVESSGDSGKGEGMFGGLTQADLPADGIALLNGGGGSSGGASGSTAEGSLYGLLPTGATKVQMVDAKGKVLALTVTTHPIPGTAYVGIYTEQHVAGETTPLIDAVSAMTWTDAAGTTHTTPYDPSS